ncbi:MAG TPA: hypothetical protein PLD18_08720 [Flavobacterium sp.]|nr:hypothetical protein [Flavobacterium sp.]
MTKKINIKITKNEALVLFDFLSRLNQNDNIDFFEDKAEKILLWNIEAELEKELEDIFDSNYKLILEKARREIHNK